MKILIAFAAFKRPTLTDMVVDYYRSLKKDFNIDIVIASSEGLKYEGCTVVEVDNLPLTNKHNALFEACKDLEHDGIILIGSDDFICPKQLQWYFDKMKAGSKTIHSFKDVYFYVTKTGNLSHFTYSHETGVGAGRFYPKAVLKKLNYKAWSGEANKGLDTNSKNYLLSLGIKEKVHELTGLIVDVKTGFNITPEIIADSGVQCDVSLLGQLGDEWAAKIRGVEYIPPVTMAVDTAATWVVMKSTSAHPSKKAGIMFECDPMTAKVLADRKMATVVENK